MIYIGGSKPWHLEFVLPVLVLTHSRLIQTKKNVTQNSVKNKKKFCKMFLKTWVFRKFYSYNNSIFFQLAMRLANKFRKKPPLRRYLLYHFVKLF